MIVEYFIMFFLFYWWLLGLLEIWDVRDMIKADLDQVSPESFYKFNPFVWLVIFFFMVTFGAFCINCDIVKVVSICGGVTAVIIALKWIFTRKYINDLLYESVDCLFCFESHVAMLLAIPIAVYYWQLWPLFMAWPAKGMRMILYRFIRIE